MSESAEQIALFDLLRAYQSQHDELRWIYSIANGGHRHKLTAVKMSREGVKRGVWDIHVPIPKGIYSGMWIEMKFGRNKLTDDQKAFGRAMTIYGHKTAVCYSWTEAANEIFGYLGIKLDLRD